MRQHEAVIKVMEQNGGFATLGFLYRNVLNIPGVEWKTKTPFASIRRIVQNPKYFFKIKPGLWALNSFRQRLPDGILPRTASSEKRKESDHSYYQAMLVEIGNLKSFHTTVPGQDKNRFYLNKRLGDLVTVNSFYKFSYEHIVRRARTIDVLWFNARNMPYSCFEVEHSTDITNSLVKFVELQDFHAKFFIVAAAPRRGEFESKINYSAFSTVSDRVRFMSYDDVSDWHAKTSELQLLESRLVL